ncbi:MAG: sulfatase-like hydrolase/transferase [Fulvivirga sp.]
MYAAQIEELDKNIGRLIAHLKKLKVYDNTLILFLSDNGCSAETGMFGMNWDKYKIAIFDSWKKEGGWSVSQGKAWANVSNVPFKMYKKYAHQGGIATPFIINWPARIKDHGAINTSSAHLIDIMATLMDVSGASYPKTFNGNDITPTEGKSLLPLISKDGVSNHEYLFWEHIGNKAVRNKQWKLVAQAGSDWELYNLAIDPTECVNLIDERLEVVEKLINEYERWATKVGVKDWPIKK